MNSPAERMRQAWSRYLDDLDKEEDDAISPDDDDNPAHMCFDISPTGSNGRIIRKQILDNE